MMAGELSQHQGKEPEVGDLHIVSHLCSQGEHGGMETTSASTFVSV